MSAQTEAQTEAQMNLRNRSLLTMLLPSFHNRNTKIGNQIFEQFGLEAMEVTDDGFESSAAIVFDQAKNRMHTIKALRTVSPDQLRRYSFAAGSMAPKVEAVCRFVGQTGGIAGIGRLEDAAAIVAGQAGTCIAPG